VGCFDGEEADGLKARQDEPNDLCGMCGEEEQHGRNGEHEQQLAEASEERRDRVSDSEGDEREQQVEAGLELASEEHGLPLRVSITGVRR
jgi:hypothetical protein